MKRILSVIATLIFIWVIYVAVEYVRCYQNGGTPFLGYVETEGDAVTKGGLGFHYITYSYDEKEKKDGDVLKEFYLFKWRLAKEIVVIINE